MCIPGGENLGGGHPRILPTREMRQVPSYDTRLPGKCHQIRVKCPVKPKKTGDLLLGGLIGMSGTMGRVWVGGG